MASTLTTFSSLLKTRYTNEKIENLTLRDHPWMAMIPKDTEGQGNDEKVPLIYVNPQRVASTMSDANGAATNIAAKYGCVTSGCTSCLASSIPGLRRRPSANPGAFLQ